MPIPAAPNPWGQSVELAPINQRNPNALCTFSRSGWSAGGLGGCNCNSSIWTTYTFDQLLLNQSTPACFLNCAALWQKPFLFGAPYIPGFILTGSGVQPYQVATLFSNASTLESFLPTTVNPLNGVIVNPLGDLPTQWVRYPWLDPAPNDIAYPGGEFVAQMITGLINDRVASTYAPNELIWTYVHNQQYCMNASMPLANYTSPPALVTEFAQYAAAIDNIRLSDYLAVIELWLYGSGLMSSTWQNAQLLNSLFMAGPGSEANLLAQSISALAAAVFLPPQGAQTENDFYRTLIAPFVHYNTIFGSTGGCTTAYPTNIPNTSASTCFSYIGIAYQEPSGPVIAPLLSNFTIQPGVNPVLCTYAPAEWTGSTAGCDCSFPTQYSYYGTNPTCTLFCDPPSYPILVGDVAAQCLLPGSCSDAAGLNLFTHANVITGLTTASNVTDNRSPGPTGHDLPIASTPLWYKNFLSAALSVYYLRRYNPTQYIYFRTLDDTLYGPNCIANATARQLWAGVNVEVALSVLNTTFFGDLTPNNFTACAAYYPLSTFEYQLCTRFQLVYNQTSGTAWGASMQANILPILQLIQAYYPDCVLGPNNCFVWTTYAGSNVLSSLPGSVMVPGPPGLPPLQLVVPEFSGLTMYTAHTMPRCTDTIGCFQRTGCAAGLFLLVLPRFLSLLLTEINLSIATGSGAWALGNDFWSNLEQILEQLFDALVDVLVGLAASFDCVICAIAGNDPTSFDCQPPGLYGIFQPIFAALEDITNALVQLIVDIIRFILYLFYGLATGNFSQIQLIMKQLILDLGNVVNVIAAAIFGSILSDACACGIFGAWPPNCVNQPTCAVHKKRSLSAAALENVTWTYQLFAADWPANSYSWSPSSWCALQMPPLSRLAPDGLSLAQAETATYCLGMITFASQPSAVGLGQVDGCARTLTLMAGQPATPFTAFDIATQSQALECIGKYAPPSSLSSSP